MSPLVVVVLTCDMTSVFVHTRHWMHLIVGAVSLWTRPPALHLCTVPSKKPTSACQSSATADLPQLHALTEPRTCRHNNGHVNHLAQAATEREGVQTHRLDVCGITPGVNTKNSAASTITPGTVLHDASHANPAKLPPSTRTLGIALKMP